MWSARLFILDLFAARWSRLIHQNRFRVALKAFRIEEIRIDSERWQALKADTESHVLDRAIQHRLLLRPVCGAT